MVKPKKSRKGSKEEEADENLEFDSKSEADHAEDSKSKMDKKSRKKAPDSGKEEAEIESFDSHKDGQVPHGKENVKKAPKKKKSKKFDSDDDEDDINNIAAKSKQSSTNFDDEDDGNVNIAASKSKKEKKGKSKMLEMDSDAEELNLNETSKRKHQSVFELLDVEEPDEMDVDAGSDDDDDSRVKERPGLSNENLKGGKLQKQSENNETGRELQKSNKKDEKGSKKSKKKKQEDEDEIDKMLAELELEYKGEKPMKSDSQPDDKRKEDAGHQNEMSAEVGEIEEKKKKKKKKKAAVDVTEQAEVDKDNDEKVVDDEGVEDGGTVKTAAQKKKEKKERERQKKLALNAQQKTKQQKSVEQDVNILHSQDLEGIPGENVEAKTQVDGKSEDDEDELEEDDMKKKKKDKKKKKQLPEKEDKDKKRPGKKQLLLMQEALKKIKEEEERQRLEEEAKMKAAEEAERLRLEKIQLEKEKKERRKLKEKERKERLKAEGKLLTKTQKQQKARAAATLEALKAHGFDVPSIGEKREKLPRLGTRVRPNKNKKNQQENAQGIKEGVEPTSPTTDADKKINEDDSLIEKDVRGKESEVDENEEDEVDEEVDNVKDAWDASSGSDGESDVEDDKKVEICIKEDRSKMAKSIDSNDNMNKSISVASSSENDDSSDDDDDEDDSESESDSDESEDSEETEHQSAAAVLRQKALTRIQKRREDAEKNVSINVLRSPIVCVLGHVDTGKTKILDKIRHTHVQDSEAGGITQQIGATMVPVYAIKDQAKMVKNFTTFEIKLPGLLIIDTPGHESFSNLRSRGSSLCDIAILVVDVMHGLEPQTIESINLLKQKKTPFIVALNKIDRLYDWKVTKNKDIRDAIKSQNRNTQMEFDQRLKEVIVQFAEQSLNAALFYDNKDTRTYVSMVPTSASTGEGMGNLLALVVELTQSMLTKRLAFSDELQATVLELKAIPGLGTTIDVILVNGRLKEGDTIVLAGMDGPVVTQIRSLLMPQPLKELRVKNPYEEFKEIQAAQGVKITAKDLEKVIAGLNLLVANHPDEVEILKEEVNREFHAAMSSIKLAERGVYVQASTLGSLEALLEFLRSSKIPYSGIRIGPVVKRDVMKASIMLEHDSQYAVILAFDVKIERDAQELADSLGVKIFSADIIYHLFDRFIEYRERLKQQKRDEFKHIAVFPCKLRILPQFIFNSRDPIVLGVSVEAGVIKEGTPLSVPSKEALEIGIVTTIEINHKTIDMAKKGQEVCIKIEPIPGDSPKMYGRHFDETDMLVSKITRQSIDACKEYFRDDLSKTDWQLMIELKKMFQIL